MTRIVPFPRTVLPWLVISALLATACGRNGRDSAQSPDARAAEPRGAFTNPGTPTSPPMAEESYRPRDKSAAAPPAAAARREAAGASADGAYRPSPSPAPEPERPGLGTEWGE